SDLLFVSQQATYQTGKAIRGGVPVCWPWFGADPQALGRPNHGLARTRLWSVASTAALPDGATRLILALTDTPDTRAVWPHAFELTLEITVGAALRLSLGTRNTGEQPFTITQALHTYLAVSDVAQTTVNGLDGCHYLDKAAGAQGTITQQRGAVRFAGEVDRIYTGAPAEMDIVDGASGRTLRISAEGSRTPVVWNPGAVLAAGMADLADDDYRRFVCVETANVADEVVTLPPGGEHRLVAQMFTVPTRFGGPLPSHGT
ncbi:MAG: D-hexose-6-phosphate mutarotase, partial [Burkholderiales bacterium RIFCSPHIGHO2_02_FULL_66_10]